jgi:glycosyltransferase involved in cell wall biosynthesis
MSAGTPVIAWRNGSVPEIIEEGSSGLVVDSMDMAVEAVGCATMIDRSVVRRFTAA